MKVDGRDPEAGSVELIGCMNLTTTADGRLEKIAAYVPALTHTSPITGISAGGRFLFQDGVDTREWLGGTTVINRLPLTDGPVAHTPIDCRVSGVTTVYKSANGSPVMQQATVGVNSTPSKRVLAAQPAFDHAFVYNAKLYAVNHADPRFLQYSEDNGYDLWSYGDGFIGHADPILQAGSIGTVGKAPMMSSGCILLTHHNGVTVHIGSGPGDFVKKFYPCKVIDGTLYSGYVSKAISFGHVFLCADGVYMVTPDGTMSNLTPNTANYLGLLNASYACATVHDGKYLAFGTTLCVEYDFRTKGWLKRASFGVKAATVWHGQNYYATGSTVSSLGTEVDNTGNFGVSLTLPFSDMGAPGIKSVTELYFSGEIAVGATITATDNTGRFWSLAVPALGKVTNRRIKTPHGKLGNHISIKIDCPAGAFRIEELRGVFAASDVSG